MRWRYNPETYRDCEAGDSFACRFLTEQLRYHAPVVRRAPRWHDAVTIIAGGMVVAMLLLAVMW